jgi:hypothetical protein
MTPTDQLLWRSKYHQIRAHLRISPSVAPLYIRNNVTVRSMFDYGYAKTSRLELLHKLNAKGRFARA